MSSHQRPRLVMLLSRRGHRSRPGVKCLLATTWPCDVASRRKKPFLKGAGKDHRAKGSDDSCRSYRRVYSPYPLGEMLSASAGVWFGIPLDLVPVGGLLLVSNRESLGCRKHLLARRKCFTVCCVRHRRWLGVSCCFFGAWSTSDKLAT